MGDPGSIGMICTMQKLGVLHLMSSKTLIEKYGCLIDTYKPLSINYLSFTLPSARITTPTPSPGTRTCLLRTRLICELD
ncbi:MAG: hypothetical protein VX679_03130 [Pseudomonadota bacterium]|nr:hypothetical protein [Pseudomonadota bacterium]